MIVLFVVEVICILTLCYMESYKTESPKLIVADSSFDKTAKKRDNSEASEGKSTNDMETYNESITSAKSKVLEQNIVGQYSSDINADFEFWNNGYYAGFFDANHENVYGYFYQITESDGEYYLQISDTNRSASITYKLVLNGLDGITLIYEDAGLSIVLEREE